MAKAPRLGDPHRYPRWWQQIDPKTVAMENFQPKDEPSNHQQVESRFEHFAEIVLQEPRPRKKGAKRPA